MAAFVEVAVELPVHGTFHYRVPDMGRGRELLGVRVLVPFGRRGISGLIVGESDEAPADITGLRDVSAFLELKPALSSPLIDLCKWVASYYQAPIGEVIRAALPVGSRRKGKARLALTEAGRAAVDGQGGALPRAVREVLAAVAAAKGGLPISKLPSAARRPGAKVDDLIGAGLIDHIHEFERARVRDKTVRMVRQLREVGDGELARAPAQAKTLQALIDSGGPLEVSKLPGPRGRASAHVRALCERGLVESFDQVVRQDIWDVHSDDALGMVAPAIAPTLNKAQADACDAVGTSLRSREYRAFLLYGITGSGKTEVYLRVIAQVIESGRGAIVLVPEISLTPQLAARFRARFGSTVAVLHSGLTDRERFDEWQRLSDGEARIALGARSAVFAPIADLGAVVVDEEHDGSFKQDEGVRYHARDVALVRAKQSNAVCVLGSATPSMETFHGAQTERLTLLELPGRATKRPLPEVEIVDLKDFVPDGDSLLTAPLAEAITKTLARKEQVILFLNRRGFNTFVLCTSCAHSFRCNSCSVSLTYHKNRDRLECHYCGAAHDVPVRCPACNGTGTIAKRGLGTERVAEAVSARFPGAKVGRLDRDVVAGTRIERVLGQMARGEIDILVGTQMVAKGHDFPRVTLVGVLLADTGLSLPDFRAAERTFQLLTQVAGRAGRADLPGRVLIQSYRTDSVAVSAAQRHDYRHFYEAESEDRRELAYPPYGHLVAIRVDGPDSGQVAMEARRLASMAQKLGARDKGVDVMGPAEAPLARLKGRTRWHLWLRSQDRQAVREIVSRLVPGSKSPGAGSKGQTRVTVDVDPISAM